MGDLSLIAGLIYIVLAICIPQSLFALDEYTMVETEPVPAIADTTGSADFTVEVVDTLGAGHGTELNFGTVELHTPSNGWLGPWDPDNDLATMIKIRFLFSPGETGERGIKIYTNNLNNMRGMIGPVRETPPYYSYIPLCWRVLNDLMSDEDFPPPNEYGQTNVAYNTYIDESKTEWSVCQILLDAGIENPQVKLDGDTIPNEEEEYDINLDGLYGSDSDGDGIEESPILNVLSDDPQAYLDETYISRLNNEPTEDDYSTSIYECYLYLINLDEIQFYSPPTDPEIPDYSSASYATVVDSVYGIQHAAYTFDKWTDRIIYVYVAGNFDIPIIGEFGTIITIETYSI